MTLTIFFWAISIVVICVSVATLHTFNLLLVAIEIFKKLQQLIWVVKIDWLHKNITLS